ncbi:MAG: DUF3810 domain-containing protein [Oscillospiraceae bacterium]|nr:DUF3810 domain-containing protein [Oscillospiraceae bacterium]
MKPAKKVLLAGWGLLFLICGADGVATALNARFFAPWTAQIFGILYFAILYGLMLLGFLTKDKKLLSVLKWYGLCVIIAYFIFLLLWMLSWKSAFAYQTSMILFSLCTAPLSCFFAMVWCFVLWAGLLVGGFMLHRRIKK